MSGCWFLALEAGSWHGRSSSSISRRQHQHHHHQKQQQQMQLQYTHTLDKNGSLYDPAGTESCDMHIRLVTKIRKSIYIYIYMGLWWPPAASYNCAQVRHHSPAGTFTRVPGRCLHWSPTSQGPRWPPAKYINRSFTSVQMCHTHTHPAFGRVVRRKMRWRWRWGGSEGEVTLKMRWKLT